MAAIVRVKRRRDETPADSLLVLCKRMKLDNATDENIKSVFKFAGTVNAKGNDVATKFVQQAIKKEKLKKEYRHHEVTWKDRCRQEHAKLTTMGRCKIINKKRAVDFQGLKDDEAGNSEEAANESKRQFLMYDAEKEEETEMKSEPAAESKNIVTCNSKQLVRSKVTPDAYSLVFPSSQFVYDLYYMNSSDFDYRMLENVLAVELTKQEFADGKQGDGDEEVEEDEDDENEEDNWRNDYPDEDPKFFENMDDEYYCGEDGFVMGIDMGRDVQVDDFGVLSEEKESENEDEDIDVDVEQVDAMENPFKFEQLYDIFKKRMNKS